MDKTQIMQAKPKTGSKVGAHPMYKLPLDDPAGIDNMLSKHEPALLLDGIPLNTPLGAVRFGQVALSLGGAELLARALRLLVGNTLAPARGVRMMLQAQIGDYPSVLSCDPSPRGSDVPALEDACYAYCATAVAHAQTGSFEAATSALTVSIVLGQAVGLTSRVGMMEIERERIQILRGMARPDELQRLLLAPMSERRRSWGRRTWAEALMSLGDYQAALRALGHNIVDTSPDRGVRNFLHAVLELPTIEHLDPKQAYSRLAEAITQLTAGKGIPSSLLGIEGEPQATYAALIDAMTLVRSPETAQQAVRLIGVATPARPDQAFLHALVWLGAMGHGVEHPSPMHVMEVIQSAGQRLRHTTALIGLACRLMPEICLLLSMSKLAEGLEIRTLDMPILVGKEILWRGERHQLPGRSGKVLVLEAAGVACNPLAREERKRLGTRLHDLGIQQVINLGAVMPAIQNIRTAVRAASQEHLCPYWLQASQRARAMFGEDMGGVHVMYPSD